ncbi:F-box/WD repeat-containing protein 7-like [Gigantopelta aegis]|uniref:F-box/WD repeat-containing protein 7-like n=1 Tax=Gigantopelta aegis TaxID=1735272 RepID=UPI001B88AFAA|nr:F-box/WD repeat-containing protein 7-like [Gigantopelta aegis]
MNSGESMGPEVTPLPHLKLAHPKKLGDSLARESFPLSWRGRGGVHPTQSGVEFDRQLDKISLWLEKWDHNQRCRILEAILRESNYNQIQFLVTVMQPSLHRDFMYTAQSYFPTIQFQPVSTHTSREVKTRLEKKRHHHNFYRVKSAYLQMDDDVRNQIIDKVVKLPDISRNSKHTQLSSRSLTKSRNGFKLNLHQMSNLSEAREKWRSANSVTTCSSETELKHYNAISRFIEMPVRRHMQDESSQQNVWSSNNSVESLLKNSERSDSIANSESNRRHKMKLCLAGISEESLSQKPAQERFQMVIECESLPEEAKQLLNWYMISWNDTKRNEFFHKLLLKLDPRQHYFISSFLSIKQQKDFIGLLPEHLAVKILSYLTPTELVQASLVNKTWHKIASNNELWKSKCEEVKVKVPISQSPTWKNIFRDNLKLQHNWKTGECRTVDLKGHTDKVLTVISDNQQLASGSQDHSIKIWDIKTGTLQQTLKGHNRGIWCLNFFTKNLLISGSYDNTIRIWNLRTGSTLRTLLGHEGAVWAMVRRGSILVTASQDKTAKIWNISQCLLLYTLTGHNAAVFAVDMDEEGTLVITGSADRSVRIWDVESGKCKKVVWASQSTSIMAVSYSNGYFACSYGETICLYKIGKAKLIRTFVEHRKRIESIELHISDPDNMTGMIVSAGKDGLVKYWDINSDQSLHTFTGHNEQVNCIYFDELRIASAGYDNKIRIWDFNI